MAVAGYNIAFRLFNNTIAGRTQDDLTIAARTVDRLTKDDEGEANVVVLGHDVTFRATGLVVIDPETGIGRDDLLSVALETDLQDQVLDFIYAPEGGASYYGTCVVTNYSESSNSSDDATITMDFRALTFEYDDPTPPTP